MFGIGGPELIVIVIVLLIFVGPEKLPEVMRTVGGGMRDLRRAANLAQAEVKRGLDELSREVEEVTRDVQDTARSVAQDVQSAGRALEDEARDLSTAAQPASAAPKPMEETIEVVRRKSTPPPRLESDPPWAVADAEPPPSEPVETGAIKRPAFHAPSTPASVLSRDALVPPPVEPVAAVASRDLRTDTSSAQAPADDPPASPPSAEDPA